MKTKLLTLIILFALSSQLSFAQFALGDIAFIGYQGDNTGNPSGEEDEFSFVLLKDVVANEAISFTDNGWLSTGGFRTGETALTLTFTGNYPIGTKISIARLPFEVKEAGGTTPGTLTGSGLSFATSGDQIFAYNPANVPNSNSNQSGFIAAIQMNGDWDANAQSSTTSAKPSVFDTLANSAIAISPEIDNAIYNCSTTSGTITELRAAIHNPGNWNVNGTTPFDQPASCNFINTLAKTNFTLLNNSFTIYPNPSNGNITIKNNGVAINTITVTDINGRVITSKNLNGITTDKNLDLSSKLTSGIYFMTISSENASVVEKLVIK